MKLTALALVLLLIYSEVQPQKQGPYKDHPHDGLNEKVAGWDVRCEFYFVGPGSGRGGLCYGIGLIPNPPLLGNSEFRGVEDGRSTTNFYIKGEFTQDYLGIHLSPSIASKLTAYHIMYERKPLYGWFHLKLEITDKDAISLEQVYADVETSEDRYAVAGSFVLTKFRAEGCGTENAERKYDYGPCQ